MELGNLILTKIKDPRLGFVTVTHVSVNPDMKSAVVFYSVMGSDKAKEESQKAFEKAVGFLQKEIATSLKLRYTPKLRFQLDDSLDQSFRVEETLRKIKEEEKK
jgi:ribosome-binding factor A